MRLDHVAYRVKNREKAILFFRDAFGCVIQNEFKIDLEDGSTAQCVAMEPPEKAMAEMIHGNSPFVFGSAYHLAPEIFISSGPTGSLIDEWVNDWGRGVGGIHHMAYQVEDVDKIMKEWLAKGWLFCSEKPLHCESLTQVFTKPNPYTNMIYEFIERRGQEGFCKGNVAKLMMSTKNL